MKILITGGSGFIGLNLQERLSREHIIFAPRSNELDLLNEAAVKDYFKNNNFDAVINCATWDATQYSQKDKSKILEHNLRMFFNVVHERGSFGRLINLGSGAEFGRPHWQPLMAEEYFDQHIPDDPYGFSKYIINKQIANLPNAVNLRLFGVFGKHEDYRIRFISNIIYLALNNLPITIRQDVAFDYLYINDLVEIINRFLNIAPRQKTYNVCTGKTHRLTVLAQIILKTLGNDSPLEISQTGLGREYSGDNSRLLAEIGEINFTPIEESIEALCLWYKENLPCLNTL